MHTIAPNAFQRKLTIDEVSERTGIPVATLRYYRHQGRGPRSFKIGRRVGYFEAEVDQWLAEQVEASSTGDRVDVPAPTPDVPVLAQVCPNCGGHGHPGGR